MVAFSTNAGKRKGLDSDRNGPWASTGGTNNPYRSTAVIFSPRIPMNTSTSTHDGSMNWKDCQTRLHTILKSCSTSSSSYQDDPILEDIVTISTLPNDKSYTTQALQQKVLSNSSYGDTIYASIQEEISNISTHVRDESTMTTHLETQLQNLHRTTAELQNQHKTVREQIHQYKQQIQQFKKTIDAAESTAATTRQERLMTVPRLQQQLSLYAAMTGIKWDYIEQENHSNQNQGHLMLIGEMVRQHIVVVKKLKSLCMTMTSRNFFYKMLSQWVRSLMLFFFLAIDSNTVGHRIFHRKIRCADFRLMVAWMMRTIP
jgi:hypothetical protein